MKNYFITESITSIDDFSRSFEFLIPNSSVNSRAQSKHFRSSGDGIISDNFYIGNNLTEHIAEIEIQNSNSCILSMPKVGHYSTRVSNQSVHEFNCNFGGVVFPSDNILYKTNSDVDVVDDLIIIVHMENLRPILENNYNVGSINKSCLELDKKQDKVATIQSFIESTLHTAKNFPHIRESLLVKSNLKEIASLLLADLIADTLQIPAVRNNSSDSMLVSKAEEYIEKECGNIFTIQEIANYFSTSPRNLQRAFKKHRDYTPIQFLKNRKLHKARKLLLANNNPLCTVKEIALGVGFFNLGRFSQIYYSMFDEYPSDTLKE